MNWKRAIGIASAGFGAAFAVTSIVAKSKKGNSVFDNEIEQKNPLEGKKVVFVKNDNDPENADGMRGHLESVGVSEYNPGFYDRYIKRGLDIVLSFSGLILLSPVFLATALAITIEDPGPVFFTQKRLGRNKQFFKLHKFRSMKVSTPHDVPTHQLDNPDQYITKVGKFIRKHSLDELPQIWDIFIGNMAVIGPRPALWNQDVLTAERDKYQANDIRPGLTGWAQINGRDELKIEDKAKLDGEYVRKFGFIMDLRCFIGSLSVFAKDDSVIEGGTGALPIEEKEEIMLGKEHKYKYSVLMSVYKNDDALFLKDALRSIYDDQTVKPDEIVVVFDGPLSERLYDVLDEFKLGKENIVKYYPQDTNKGLGEALRIGAEACTGDYILRMDSDDISDPKRFEKQIRFVESHPEIDVVGTDISEFEYSLNEKMRVRSCPATHNEIVAMGKRRNPMNHVTVCMKRHALEECGGYKTLLLLEDYYLWLHMISAGFTLANIKESLVYVRVGNGFNSKRGSKERIEGWKVLQEYMLKEDMITKKEATLNMLYIRMFVKTPACLKKMAYAKFLRV